MLKQIKEIIIINSKFLPQYDILLFSQYDETKRRIICLLLGCQGSYASVKVLKCWDNNKQSYRSKKAVFSDNVLVDIDKSLEMCSKNIAKFILL